jgi:UDP-N-acetyl-D-glucosamine/UDP-N-acetyl-D-galactosamine dehydrogenase
LAVTAVGERRYDLVVGAVGHREYRELSDEQIESMIAPGGTLADLKGVWRDRQLGGAIDRWTL